jgi:hypothetical protein
MVTAASLAGTGAGSPERARERGAAVFIVVMVITLLTAIGIFAVRSASLLSTSSGYARRAAQAHYMAEYALSLTIAELGTGTAGAYYEEMINGKDTCRATSNIVLPNGARAPCYTLHMRELAARVDQHYSGRRLVEPAVDGNPAVPGSLGPFPPSSQSALAGDFVIELTDPGPANTPVAGTDIGGTGTAFRYMQLALTATGQIMPAAANACDDATSGSSGIQSVRAHVTVGPLPR